MATDQADQADQVPRPEVAPPRGAVTVVRRIAGWLLVVAAIPAGAIGAVVGLVAVAAITGHRVLAAVGATLVLLVCTGGVVRLAAALITARHAPRRWLTGAVTAVTTAGVGFVIWGIVFGPTPPSNPLPMTADVRFWQLPTGSRIAYTHAPAQGEPRPSPVVLVHGGPGSPDGPRGALVRELSAGGFDVYDYHQIGAGLSGRLADVSDYTVARHVADLEAIRQAIGAERLALVGASWGGTLIANYLAAHPDRVERAVVSSPGEIWAPAGTEADRLTEAGRRDQEEAIGRHPQFVLAQVLLSAAGPRAASTLFPDARMDGVFESMVSELDMRPGCASDPPSGTEGGWQPRGFGFWANAATSLDSGRTPDPRPALGAATAPVLVLRGECDYIHWNATREYRDLLPNATLLAIDDAGHTIPTHQPDLYRETVRAFLLGEGLPRPAYLGADPPW
ncbi:alpha/beta hydrolase [Actinopolymorpha pittospori]